MIPGTKKLLGVTKAERLKVITVYNYLKYKPGKPFKWFPEEVSQARHNEDNNPR